jgi:prepilin-type N-terminal cleavage/methylation domain-containing protein
MATTSVTGSPAAAAGAVIALRPREPRCREGGFTLVELMVVMAIIVALFALVAVSVGGLQGKAAQRATEAMIRKVEQYLDDYKRRTGSFPPDGIDSQVTNEEGTPIQGSACLYYFLSKKPIPLVEIRAGKKIITELPPIGTFLESELGPASSEYPGARELIDGWRNPIHYDNTQDGEFRPQRGRVHLPPIDDEEHPQDPRDGTYDVGKDHAVQKMGVQSDSYDLWSYGEQGHEVKELNSLPIASWNLKE